MAEEHARLCLNCGHPKMGAGKATMQCTHCAAWDWPNMSREAEQFVRRNARQGQRRIRHPNAK